MSRPQKSRSPRRIESAPAPRPEATASVAAPKPGRSQLWLAIDLPCFAFDAHGASRPDGAAAVVEPLQGQLRIVAVNRAAASAGVRPGIKLAAALALTDTLAVLEREPRAERAALESFAAWARRFSPLVVAAPAGLSLELAGSLKLFRSLDAVKRAVGAELAARGWTFRCCVAPTALGAAWLARHGGQADVATAAALPGRLGALPLRVTRWPDAALRLLRDLGVRTVADCMRLPRDGFARRAGRACLDDLDKALGRGPDPQPALELPRRWHARRVLDEDSTDREALLQVVAGLLDSLAVELRRRQSQVQMLKLVLEHRRCAATVTRLVLVEGGWRRERLLKPLAARLERLALPAPVTAVQLTTGRLAPLQAVAADLFAAGHGSGARAELLEQLRERFGVAVFGVGGIAEHRPEYAWTRLERPPARAAAMRTAAAAVPVWRRPLWLLPAPLPLASSAARAYCQGVWRLDAGPERIESGWWDERDVRRDYYTATDAGGRSLWVYRERGSRAWYLHGLFG